jgi:hypothetical protein
VDRGAIGLRDLDYITVVEVECEMRNWLRDRGYRETDPTPVQVLDELAEHIANWSGGRVIRRG